MEREPSRHTSRIIGLLMVLAIVPALLMFVGRDVVDMGSSPSAGDGGGPTASSLDVGPTGIASVGAGTCTLESTGVLIEGVGMTSCRTQQWASNTPGDLDVGAVVDGIDAGATAIIRLRESGGERVEVAIGRSNVVVRQLDDGVWSFISTTERPSREGIGPNRVAISMVGGVISIDVDGRFVSAGITTVLEPGALSVGAVLGPGVAVRFASVELSDAG